MPELYMTAEDHAYMKAGVKRAGSSEIGFLGVVEIAGGDEEKGVPSTGLVKHLRILKQETSSGEVEFDDEAFADYLEWLYTPEDKGGAGFTGTDYGLFSAHSHGNGSTFWSSTDEDAIKKYGLSAPWVFSSVFNTNNDSKHRLDVFKGLKASCALLTTDSQITFKDPKLIVLYHPMVQPIMQEINRVGARFEKKIDELKAEIVDVEKERDSSIKGLQDSIRGVTDEPLREIGKRIENDYKNLVSDSWGNWKRTSTSSSGATGGRGKASSKESQTGQSPSSSGGSHNGVSPKESGGGDHTDPYERDLSDVENPYKLIYRVIDTDISAVYGCNLGHIINDDDLMLLEPVELEVLKMLTAEEIGKLNSRDQSNVLDAEVIKRLITTKKKEESKKAAKEKKEKDKAAASK